MRATILVVDDDAMIRNLLRLMLEPMGFQVIEAHNGFDALEKVTRNRPDVLILNVMMPGLDGISVCEMIRSAEKTSTLPIIILSGQAHLTAMTRGLRAGATRYLTKPMSRRTLIETLEEILDG